MLPDWFKKTYWNDYIMVLYHSFLKDDTPSVWRTRTTVASHHAADARGQFEHVRHSGSIKQLVLQLKQYQCHMQLMNLYLTLHVPLLLQVKE